MPREYYSDSIEGFLATPGDAVLGRLVAASDYYLEMNQRDAWMGQVSILKDALKGRSGKIYFEYSIPRMGRRIDTLLVIGSAIFVLEFKVGEKEFNVGAIDQVWDYALDLKNFHETSHDVTIVPILIATKARLAVSAITKSVSDDKVFNPIHCNEALLADVIADVLRFIDDEPAINAKSWEAGSYQPTPTIIEAAMALYSKHSVEEITRSDASAINLAATTKKVLEVIQDSKEKSRKSICFITGVPGAGKTLVGLNVATTHDDHDNDLFSVFLSGNGPLVAVLREALVRDKVKREKEAKRKITKSEVFREVKMFIQNVHNFRDLYLEDRRPPPEHVVLFDEAQRAWNLEQTANFMKRKRGLEHFEMSEPEFLISCLDRHPDWAVIVCLVGGGQEINTGEAGIGEWISALQKSFPDWRIYTSSKLNDSEYGAGHLLADLRARQDVVEMDELHLSVSMRSFRAENVSLLVKQLLDVRPDEARRTLAALAAKYPIVVTRDLARAKAWLKAKARGSERYGILVSSQAERLRPYAIDVRPEVDPIHWFLEGKDDVRSSYYLEDVATEFHCQGLEIDWACVTWDADFRFNGRGWDQWSFRANKWQHINQPDRKLYQKNAYRVLLTRARQGMVI